MKPTMKTPILFAITAGVLLSAGACTDTDLDADGAQVIDITAADLAAHGGSLVLPLHDGDTYRVDHTRAPVALDQVELTDGELALDLSQLVPPAAAEAPILALTAEAGVRGEGPWSFTLDTPAVQAKPNTGGGGGTCIEWAYHEVEVTAGDVTVTIPIWFCKAWN